VTVPGGLGPRRQPVIGDDSRFYWEAAKRGELVAQRCTACGELRHPPRPMCPSCHSFDWQEERMSGDGTIYTWTVHHHPPVPGIASPHAVVVVSLPEGIRMVGQLMGEGDAGAPPVPAIGGRVRVSFLDIGENVLPVWAPAQEPS
jgi:uncharacterized protein